VEKGPQTSKCTISNVWVVWGTDDLKGSLDDLEKWQISQLRVILGKTGVILLKIDIEDRLDSDAI